jgi:uncharacterized protein YjiK
MHLDYHESSCFTSFHCANCIFVTKDLRLPSIAPKMVATKATNRRNLGMNGIPERNKKDAFIKFKNNATAEHIVQRNQDSSALKVWIAATTATATAEIAGI